MAIGIKIGLGDGLYCLDPKGDITPQESTRLMELMVCSTAYTPGTISNYPSVGGRLEFIEKHNLSRHFTRVEE